MTKRDMDNVKKAIKRIRPILTREGSEESREALEWLPSDELMIKIFSRSFS